MADQIHEPATEPDRAVDQRAAARLLGFQPTTLRDWRSEGIGPRFIRLGRSVRYRLRDLRAWQEAHAVETRDSLALAT